MPPTLFQRKMLWAAVTALSFVTVGAVIVLVGRLVIDAISYLQPLLIPVAISAILAYLLDPVVNLLRRWRFSRTWAIITVFCAILLISAGILVWIIPAMWQQGHSFANNLPQYTARAQALIVKTTEEVKRISELPIFRRPEDPNAPKGLLATNITTALNDGVAWLQTKVPDIAVSTGHILQKSFGVFGFLLSLILVPIFLFFFLKEGPSISQNWSKYLPLRASPLKSEIVSLVTEINSYLISFFRGQLIVSLIDGALIAFFLIVIVRLDFALLIGLMVGILGLIPYIGMMICWVPAVLIAAMQYGDWWHPLVVTIIFIGANQLEGIFISPKIVGESVGLHPLTVIISVLAWSLILGGILGALLAVPLTATLKVLLKRYFWDRPAGAMAPP